MITATTIQHEEINYSSRRKIIIDTALIDGKYETMVIENSRMFKPKEEELESRVTTGEKQARIDFAELFDKYAGQLQRTIYGANLQEGEKYTILTCGEVGFPIARKFTFRAMKCTTHAQFNDVVQLEITPYREKSKYEMTLYGYSFIILDGWHDLTESDTYNIVHETDTVKTMMSKYCCFDSNYIEDMERKFQPFIIATYKNYKTGANGKTYA